MAEMPTKRDLVFRLLSGTGPRKEPEHKPLDLDDVLVNELGQFGRYQLLSLALVAIPTVMSAFMSEYIFSAVAIPHRCMIPEFREVNKSFPFQPEWILNAVPQTSGVLPSCERFAPAGGNGSLDHCPTSSSFERPSRVRPSCMPGAALWSMIVGTFLVLPFTGLHLAHISDRFGRHITQVVSVFNMALFGLIRAFSVNYPMYLALQLVQTTLGAGTFSTSYIFVR